MNMKSKRNGTSTSAAAEEPLGKSVEITEQYLTVTLQDGRVIGTPLEWYPRLVRGTPEQRAAWKWIADGIGITWPLLDEDLGIEGMLNGVLSIEYRRQAALAHAAA
jgi:Protein of unknown function (DUF2442)